VLPMLEALVLLNLDVPVVLLNLDAPVINVCTSVIDARGSGVTNVERPMLYSLDAPALSTLRTLVFLCALVIPVLEVLVLL